MTGICECLVMPPSWSLQFGGRQPAHFVCDHCGRRYDLDGNLLPGRPARRS